MDDERGVAIIRSDTESHFVLFVHYVVAANFPLRPIHLLVGIGTAQANIASLAAQHRVASIQPELARTVDSQSHRAGIRAGLQPKVALQLPLAAVVNTVDA